MRLVHSPALGPAALALLPLMLYGRFLLGDELYNADVFLAYRPAHAWLAGGLRQGRIPLWNPNLLGGFPLAFSEYGWFSPLNWVPLVLLGGHSGFYLAVALYVAMAGLSAYLLAHAIGASRTGAMLTGGVYGLSPFVVGGTPLLNQGAAYWALPGGLLLVHLALKGDRWAAPLLGVVVALTLLGSHPQLAIIALVPPALYAAGATVRRRQWSTLTALGIAGALGVAVSAVRFLPTLPLVAASERSAGLAFGASAIGSVAPPNLLAGLIFPSLQIPRFVSPQWTAYVGALPLTLCLVHPRRIWGTHPWIVTLALSGLVFALGSYTPVFWLVQRTPLLTYFREPSRFLLWTVLGIALLAGLALERATTLPKGRVNWWPVAAVLSLIASFVLVGFALHWLEDWALERLYLNVVNQVRQRDYPAGHYASLVRGTWLTLVRSVNPLSPGLLVPLASLFLSAWWWVWGRHGRLAVPAALICTLLPLLAYDTLRLPAVPREVVQETALPTLAVVPAAVPPTRPTGGSAVEPPARTLSWLPLAADFELRAQLEGAGLDADVASYRLLRRLLAPNFGVLRGVPQLDGYENLMTREQSLLTAALGSERTGSTSDLALVRQRLPERRRIAGERWGLATAAGVGTVLSVERLQPATWPMAVRYDPGVVRSGSSLSSVNAFRVSGPLPRAYLTTDWRVVASAEEAVRALVASEADGQPATVITRGASYEAPSPRQGTQRAEPAGFAPATIWRYEERLVELEVSTRVESLLVLLDAQAPGWTATVTGAPAPVLTANVAFRAVLVPAGNHLVRFEYTPSNWQAGLTITSASTATLLVWLAWVLANSGSRFTRGHAVKVRLALRPTQLPCSNPASRACASF